MADLPTGTVAFLFTDIEGSTRAWERDPAGTRSTLERQDFLLRKSIAANAGHLFKTVGDGYCAAFDTAADALAAALAGQLALQRDPGGGGGTPSDPAPWLDRLEREHDNLRAALEWSQTQPESAEAGLRLAGAVYHFWYVRGYMTEGRQWLEGALVAGGAASVGPRARALYAAGYLAWTQGDGQRAPALLEQSLALYRDLGDKRGLARTFNTLAALANEQSEYEKAALLLEEGLVFARDIEATDLMATLLNNHAETWLRAETSNRREPSINKHWLRFLLQAVRRAASCFSISAWWRVPKAIIPRHAPSTPEA